MGGNGRSGAHLRTDARKCHQAIYHEGTKEEDERPLIFVEYLLSAQYHPCVIPGS